MLNITVLNASYFKNPMDFLPLSGLCPVAVRARENAGAKTAFLHKMVTVFSRFLHEIFLRKERQ